MVGPNDLPVSLSPTRAVAYGFGSLTGAFGAVALLAWRSGRRRAAGLAVVFATLCGGLSVEFEERASDRQTAEE